MHGIQETRGQDAELSGVEQQKLAQMSRDVDGLARHTAEYRSEVERAQVPEKYANLGTRLTGRRQPGTGRIDCRPGSQVMPLDFGVEALRAAHGKVLRQEPCLLETRASNTASPEIPPQLFPVPTFPVHPDRIADRLPAFALDAPSWSTSRSTA